MFVAAASATLTPALAVTVQGPGNVFNGRSYLYVEAENFSSRGDDPEDDGWKIVSKQSPIQSTQGLDILPAGSNVSGTALLDDNGGGNHSDTVTYELQFSTAGTYQFYSRHTMYDVNGNGNFGNEDSIFLSPAFNLNSSSDWTGFTGLEWNDAIGESPDPGFALDPAGFEEKMADGPNEGWFATRDWGVKSNGVVTFNNNASENFWNGNFHWYNRPAFVSVGPSGGFDDDFGFKTEYVVTEEMVGQTVTFEIGNREPYVVLDGFLFIQDDAVDLLDNISQEDLDAVLVPVGPTLRADFDDSGAVDDADYTAWQGGFGTASGALKANGDADGDGAVTGADLLIWQAERGAGTASSINAAGVPEPTSAALVALLSLSLASGLRRRGTGN
jgi:hypothetical protein